MRARLRSAASRWGWPLITVAVVGFITVIGTVAGRHSTGRPIDARAVALLAVAAGASGPARRWPLPSLGASLAATVLYLGLGYPFDSSFFIGLGVTAYLAVSGTTGPRLRTAVLGALVLALFWVAGLFADPSNPSAALAFGAIVTAALVAGQVAAEWRARADARTAEAHEAEALRRLAEERLRIARELHDVVSHSISIINVQAGVAVHVMAERPEAARAALVAIRAVSGEALRDLRTILGLLRQTDDAEPRGPAAGLEQVPALADNVRTTGVRVELDLEEADGQALPRSVDLIAYRVIQEGLTNVVRHAPGAAATVTVRRQPEALLVEVVDDGRSTASVSEESRHGAGHGLAGMRERLRAAGGSLEAGALPGGGFLVRARLPLAAEPA